jgi:uncharacterized protein YndB with AHSA1/START domain
MTNTFQAPVATVQMLIRKPVAQVFEAFADPSITSHFWFSRGSGLLAAGTRVRWDWEMYGFHIDVEVKELEQNKRILIEWNEPHPTLVEWIFDAKAGDQTFVQIKNWGFSGDEGKVVSEAINSAGGFSFVLAAAKVFLEHGIEPNLIVDHDPDSVVAGWSSR